MEACDGVQTEQVPGRVSSLYPGAFCDMCFITCARWAGKRLGEQVSQPRVCLPWSCWPVTCKIEHMIRSFIQKWNLDIWNAKPQFLLSVTSPNARNPLFNEILVPFHLAPREAACIRGRKRKSLFREKSQHVPPRAGS